MWKKNKKQMCYNARITIAAQTCSSSLLQPFIKIYSRLTNQLIGKFNKVVLISTFFAGT